MGGVNELPLWHQGTGEERRDAALDHHESRYAEVLEGCRAHLRALALRERRAVHADDAREYLNKTVKGQQLLSEPNNAWMGSLFRTKGWRAVDWHKSVHPENHARSVRTWVPTGESDGHEADAGNPDAA